MKLWNKDKIVDMTYQNLILNVADNNFHKYVLRVRIIFVYLKTVQNFYCLFLLTNEKLIMLYLKSQQPYIIYGPLLTCQEGLYFVKWLHFRWEWSPSASLDPLNLELRVCSIAECLMKCQRSFWVLLHDERLNLVQFRLCCRFL